MERRTYLTAAGVATTALLAGCLGEFRPEGAGDGPEETSDTGGSDEDAETRPEGVIETYLLAVEDADRDAMAEVVHSSSPLDPERYDDDELEYDPGEVGEFDADDAEVVTEDASIEEIFDVEKVSTLFDEDELEADIGDENVALVEADTDYRTSASDSEIWVLVTEDDAWRVFWVGAEADAPDDPEDAFEEPITDEHGDVVAELDWEYEQDADDEYASSVEWVRVVLTDSPGIEADAVRVESTVEGGEFELSGDEPNGWAGSWANLPLHPDGDQIVVTVVENGTEEVVHREHYEP